MNWRVTASSLLLLKSIFDIVLLGHGAEPQVLPVAIHLDLVCYCGLGHGLVVGTWMGLRIWTPACQ